MTKKQKSDADTPQAKLRDQLWTKMFISTMQFLAQDLLAAPASQAYVERVFSVCGHLTAGKRNRLCKKLANGAFLKVNNKFYD